jgi:hypothetical protein
MIKETIHCKNKNKKKKKLNLIKDSRLRLRLCSYILKLNSK